MVSTRAGALIGCEPTVLCVTEAFIARSGEAHKKGDPKAAFVCSSQHQRLVTESGIESMVGWFEINVLAELSSFSSPSIPIHVDVFPFH